MVIKNTNITACFVNKVMSTLLFLIATTGIIVVSVAQKASAQPSSFDHSSHPAEGKINIEAQISDSHSTDAREIFRPIKKQDIINLLHFLGFAVRKVETSPHNMQDNLQYPDQNPSVFAAQGLKQEAGANNPPHTQDPFNRESFREGANGNHDYGKTSSNNMLPLVLPPTNIEGDFYQQLQKITPYPSYYAILGVSRDASSDKIETAYQNILLRFNIMGELGLTLSDSAQQQLNRVKKAYQVLIDPKTREQYNRDPSLFMEWADHQTVQEYLNFSTISKPNYYKVLKIPKDASPEEIKQAYRRLARKTHPDAHQSDPIKLERFREIAEAYDVLSDPEKRRNYDYYESLKIKNYLKGAQKDYNQLAKWAGMRHYIRGQTASTTAVHSLATYPIEAIIFHIAIGMYAAKTAYSNIYFNGNRKDPMWIESFITGATSAEHLFGFLCFVFFSGQMNYFYTKWLLDGWVINKGILKGYQIRYRFTLDQIDNHLTHARRQAIGARLTSKPQLHYKGYRAKINFLGRLGGQLGLGSGMFASNSFSEFIYNLKHSDYVKNCRNDQLEDASRDMYCRLARQELQNMIKAWGPDYISLVMASLIAHSFMDLAFLAGRHSGVKAKSMIHSRFVRGLKWKINKSISMAALAEVASLVVPVPGSRIRWGIGRLGGMVFTGLFKIKEIAKPVFARLAHLLSFFQAEELLTRPIGNIFKDSIKSRDLSRNIERAAQFYDADFSATNLDCNEDLSSCHYNQGILAMASVKGSWRNWRYHKLQETMMTQMAWQRYAANTLTLVNQTKKSYRELIQSKDGKIYDSITFFNNVNFPHIAQALYNINSSIQTFSESNPDMLPPSEDLDLDLVFSKEGSFLKPGSAIQGRSDGYHLAVLKELFGSVNQERSLRDFYDDFDQALSQTQTFVQNQISEEQLEQEILGWEQNLKNLFNSSYQLYFLISEDFSDMLSRYLNIIDDHPEVWNITINNFIQFYALIPPLSRQLMQTVDISGWMQTFAKDSPSFLIIDDLKQMLLVLDEKLRSVQTFCIEAWQQEQEASQNLQYLDICRNQITELSAFLKANKSPLFLLALVRQSILLENILNNHQLVVLLQEIPFSSPLLLLSKMEEMETQIKEALSYVKTHCIDGWQEQSESPIRYLIDRCGFYFERQLSEFIFANEESIPELIDELRQDPDFTTSVINAFLQNQVDNILQNKVLAAGIEYLNQVIEQKMHEQRRLLGSEHNPHFVRMTERLEQQLQLERMQDAENQGLKSEQQIPLRQSEEQQDIIPEEVKKVFYLLGPENIFAILYAATFAPNPNPVLQFFNLDEPIQIKSYPKGMYNVATVNRFHDNLKDSNNMGKAYHPRFLRGLKTKKAADYIIASAICGPDLTTQGSASLLKTIADVVSSDDPQKAFEQTFANQSLDEIVDRIPVFGHRRIIEKTPDWKWLRAFLISGTSYVFYPPSIVSLTDEEKQNICDKGLLEQWASISKEEDIYNQSFVFRGKTYNNLLYLVLDLIPSEGISDIAADFDIWWENQVALYFDLFTLAINREYRSVVHTHFIYPLFTSSLQETPIYDNFNPFQEPISLDLKRRKMEQDTGMSNGAIDLLKNILDPIPPEMLERFSLKLPEGIFPNIDFEMQYWINLILYFADRTKNTTSNDRSIDIHLLEDRLSDLIDIFHIPEECKNENIFAEQTYYCYQYARNILNCRNTFYELGLDITQALDIDQKLQLQLPGLLKEDYRLSLMGNSANEVSTLKNNPEMAEKHLQALQKEKRQTDIVPLPVGLMDFALKKLDELLLEAINYSVFLEDINGMKTDTDEDENNTCETFNKQERSTTT